jgi:hypothetical protein
MVFSSFDPAGSTALSLHLPDCQPSQAHFMTGQFPLLIQFPNREGQAQGAQQGC